jgi:hypothetical protein
VRGEEQDLYCTRVVTFYYAVLTLLSEEVALKDLIHILLSFSLSESLISDAWRTKIMREGPRENGVGYLLLLHCIIVVCSRETLRATLIISSPPTN